MHDATGGTHADGEALELQRRTEAYPGEPTPLDLDEQPDDERPATDVLPSGYVRNDT